MGEPNESSIYNEALSSAQDIVPENPNKIKYAFRNDTFMVRPIGNWTIENLRSLESPIERLKDQIIDDNSSNNSEKPNSLQFDFSGLGEIDTAGAFLLSKLISPNENLSFANIEYVGNHSAAPRLLNEINRYKDSEYKEPTRPNFTNRIANMISRAFSAGFEEIVNSLSFIGQTIVCLIKAIINPLGIRWIPTIAIAQSAGLNAIALVVLLTGFIGVVLTFMGAQTLQNVGASVFTIDLLGISILREFGVFITAIIISGRSASAFAAQIGSMKMGQEIDAMSIIGLDPMEVLVIPRVLALLLMLPILVFFAMISGLFTGALTAILTLDISPTMFLSRLQEQVGVKHFWVGMSKAPVFAVIIAIIGCRQGLMVENDVISLGKRTTSAVVQSIMMVIIVEAIFAIIYYELEI